MKKSIEELQAENEKLKEDLDYMMNGYPLLLVEYDGCGHIISGVQTTRLANPQDEFISQMDIDARALSPHGLTNLRNLIKDSASKTEVKIENYYAPGSVHNDHSKSLNINSDVEKLGFIEL